MQIIAHIKRASSIWRLWRAHQRTGGVVAGVRFTSLPGDNYATAPLNPQQAAELKNHPDIVLEATAIATRQSLPVKKPAEPEVVSVPADTHHELDDIVPQPALAAPPPDFRHQQQTRPRGRPRKYS